MAKVKGTPMHQRRVRIKNVLVAAGICKETTKMSTEEMIKFVIYDTSTDEFHLIDSEKGAILKSIRDKKTELSNLDPNGRDYMLISLDIGLLKRKLSLIGDEECPSS